MLKLANELLSVKIKKNKKFLICIPNAMINELFYRIMNVFCVLEGLRAGGYQNQIRTKEK